MTSIIAPEGSPLSIAVIGARNLEASLVFYRDIIGLTASDPVIWKGDAFETLWHLPKGSKAKAVFCELPGCEAGRILLLEFDAKHRKSIRPENKARAYGLMNVNFYTDDIQGDTAKLKETGYNFWSAPTFYEMSGAAGSPTEVIFDGPDSVAVNLVQLSTSDPNTTIGQMYAYTRKNGRTSTGFTPVVTSSHVARNISKAVAFYEKVLKCGVLIDAILERPEQNKFLKMPEGARTAVKFMQGNHMFGKIALSGPLNYECADMTPDAVAPNIGYIAQAFVVKSLSAAQINCDQIDAKVYTPRMDIEVPGVGHCSTLIVHNPGSNALQQMLQLT